MSVKHGFPSLDALVFIYPLPAAPERPCNDNPM